MILELIHKNSKSKRKMDYRMSSKKRSQRLLLLALALGMAMVGVMLLSKLREGRVFRLLVRDQDQQILTLQLLLQRERETSKAIKRKLDDFRTKNFILRTQKTELSNKLMEAQTAADHLQKMQNEMEASLEEKQNQIKSLSEKAEESNLKVADLSKLLKQKATEFEEAKNQLEKLSTNSKEERKANNENEVKNEQKEETPKEGEWVEFQTNGDVETSDNDKNETPTFSLGSTSQIKQNEDHRNGEEQAVDTDREIETSQESATEIKEESKEPENDQLTLNNMEQKGIVAAQEEQEKPATPKVLQNEDLRNGEEQAADTDREIEMSQESATEINEESKEPENDQLTLNNMEQKGIVAAQDEQEKPATPKELTIEAEGKEHKVRRNKNKRKGRRRRTIPRGREYDKHIMKEDNKYGPVEKHELESEQKEIAHETTKSEIADGSQVDGSLNGSQGQINLEARDEIASTKEQSEKSKNPRNNVATNESKEESNANSESIPKQIDVATVAAEDEEDSKVHEADSTDKNVEGEGKEITPTKEQLEKLENPREDEAKNESTGDVTRAPADLNTEKESDSAKQEEEEDLNTNPKYITEDGEDSKVHKGEETMPTKEQTEKPENPKDHEVKNDNPNDETRASVYLKTEKESDSENHDVAVKEAAYVSTTQISESTTNTDDSSSEEDKEQ